VASKRQKKSDRKLVEVRIIRGKDGAPIRTIVAARLHALIVRRVVCIDLTRGLTQNSAVILYRHPLWRPSKAA
jgi:hypothetical protein